MKEKWNSRKDKRERFRVFAHALLFTKKENFREGEKELEGPNGDDRISASFSSSFLNICFSHMKNLLKSRVEQYKMFLIIYALYFICFYFNWHFYLRFIVWYEFCDMNPWN